MSESGKPAGESEVIRAEGLGKTYAVASALADREIASEIYSTAGNYDILAKFHVDDAVDIGHFVAENVHTIPEIQDTKTIITFKAF